MGSGPDSFLEGVRFEAFADRVSYLEKGGRSVRGFGYSYKRRGNQTLKEGAFL